MRVEIKVFAKSLQRHNDARNALRAVQGSAEVFLQAFVGQGAEPLQQVAVALEKGQSRKRVIRVDRWLGWVQD